MSDFKQAVRLKALRREYLPQVCKNSRVARLNGYNVKFIAIVINGIIHMMEVFIMESISVKKSEVVRFRVAEMLRKVSKFVKSFSYRMEVIK